jgi:CheY-like chemotaxis protein
MANAALSPPVILVVDDNAQLRALLPVLLRRILPSCAVIVATDGADALAVIAQQPIHLVITDYRMPGMSGVQLAAAIKTVAPTTRVALYTLQPSSELRADAQAAGVDAVIAKPFQLAELTAVVGALLP